MSKPSKRDIERLQRMERLRQQAATPATAAATAPGEAPSPAVADPAESAAGAPAALQPGQDVSEQRASGSSVSKLVSMMAGGMSRELEETKAQRDELEQRLAERDVSLRELQMRLEALAQGEAGIQSLDTNTIRLTAFDNRDPKSFDDADPDFAELKADIAAKGGNLIPGLVRPVEVPEGQVVYEVVYGNRRYMACHRLGLQFRAFVQTVSDEEAMLLQHVENAHRKGLSPIETATKINSFLQHRRYSESGRAHMGSLPLLAESLELDKKYVGKLALIGQIPPHVLARIPDVREIPFRPAYLLARRCRDAMEEVEKRLQDLPDGLSSRRVVQLLIGEAAPGPIKAAPSNYVLAFSLPGDQEAAEAFQREVAELAKRYGVQIKSGGPGNASDA